jgi:hypothetical protein
MPENSQPDRVQTFVIRGETLRGTTHDILRELDQEILGLLVLRQKLAGEIPAPAQTGRRTGVAHDVVRRLATTLGCTHG